MGKLEIPEPELPWAERPVWRGCSCGPGWYKIITDLDEALCRVYPDYEVVQVKEKFGTLRFYIGGVPEPIRDVVYDAIADAERISARTCEWCGEPGTSRSGGWVRTLCDGCEAEYQEERANRWSGA